MFGQGEVSSKLARIEGLEKDIYTGGEIGYDGENGNAR